MKFQKQSQQHRLAPGKYFYCNCGTSSEFPFCDGSHSGTEHSPKKFSIETADTYTLCACGKSLAKPYCDGSHRSL